MEIIHSPVLYVALGDAVSSSIFDDIRTKSCKVPYLEDPNTGVQMFESAEIVDYLKATYAL